MLEKTKLTIEDIIEAINEKHDFKVIPLIDNRYIDNQLLSVVKPCGYEEQIGTIRIEDFTIIENLDFCFHYSLDEVETVYDFLKKYADENGIKFVSNRVQGHALPALSFKTLDGEEPCQKKPKSFFAKWFN